MKTVAFLALATAALPAFAGTVTTQNPILFVAAMPVHEDFATNTSTFANHFASINEAGRGGDLYIRYPNGTLCNLTQQAGYGSTGVFVPSVPDFPTAPPGFQDGNAIAVRDPAVHWNGTKAVFSMVIGTYPVRYQYVTSFWQLYEVTGLANCATTVITKVANQPEGTNNIMPTYLSDGSIAFVSDRSRTGEAHLYPQLDEYESTPTPTGLWRLDPTTGALKLLEHSPSGSFHPIVDSFGRIVFTRWDHLQRDQQADDPNENPNGAYDWSSEAAGSVPTANRVEVFPEQRTDEYAPPGVNGLRFNHFFPWMIQQDGRDLEVLEHLGRHELHDYFNHSFNTDPDLADFNPAGRTNPNELENMFQIAEDPQIAGRYIGIDAPEFDTHGAGRIVELTSSPVTNPDGIVVSYITHPDTKGTEATVNHSGHYRDPLPTTDGLLIAAHTPDQGGAASLYDFRLRLVVEDPGPGIYRIPGAELTDGIVKTISYWTPDTLVTLNNVTLWELWPTEVVARTVPPTPTAAIPAPEQAAFAAAGVDPEVLESWMKQQNLALVVSRDVTTRDAADRQQPYNLQIAHNPATQTTGSNGAIYDVAYLQFFQGDQIRSYNNIGQGGRRVLARELHDPAAITANGPTTGPAGSVRLGNDGSMAAFLPAHRATTWQLTGPANTSFPPVVRERYWLSFQPGEVRVCASCHGLNTMDQSGGGVPTNTPQALVDLLNAWQANGWIFGDGFESGDSDAWSAQVP